MSRPTSWRRRGRSEDAQGAITYLKIPATGADQVNTVDVKVRNTVFNGHLRGVHLLNLAERTRGKSPKPVGSRPGWPLTSLDM